MEEFEKNQNDALFAKSVRAGKRTYFFDVKATKGDEYYVTITESKRKFNQETGNFYYEKHKIFLYKEDFEKFLDGLNDAMDFVKLNSPAVNPTLNGENNLKTDDDLEFDNL